ncbi:ABC transporter permease [Tunicatimonas pelagia]|uniref:ABC transporter permease n=1 Tax=Tunicatimonas pelagia TaxID=931531 RepID=UPI002664FC82|nr:ABC transporter permease [Tunicatimonas pelagia]WKN40687.1 ABC transporter permease [Tunicatimonas pelagia]
MHENQHPPQWIDRLLESFCSPHLLEEVQGDLQELYGEWRRKYGERKANWLYLWHALKFFRPFALRKNQYSNTYRTMMLKHYFTTAYRNLMKHKSFSIINVAGLVLGITCFTLIALYVRYELSFDRFHPDADRIYRVIQQQAGSGDAFSRTGGAHITPLQDIAELEEIVRLYRTSIEVQRLDDARAERLSEEQFYFADSNFFDVFNFQLLMGDKDVLASPSAVILTESTAQRYFGDQDPLGQAIRIGDSLSLEVQGVMEDTPENAHFSVDFLTSIAALKQYYNNPGPFESYWWPWLWTFVKLQPGAEAAAINSQIVEAVKKYRGENVAKQIVPQLQPITSIHLYSTNTTGDPSANSDITYVAIFSAISLLILLIACINFTNLSLARSVKRAKEVGIRKAAGAGRGMLMRQFLGESFLLSILALTVGLLLAELLLPYFNDLAHRSLEIAILNQLSFWLPLLGIVILTGLLAGSYPAWILSGLQAARVLKGSVGQKLGSRQWLQQSLVVLQFVASIALIAGTLITYQQLTFLQETSLGFEQEQVLTVPVPEISSTDQVEKLTALEQKFSQLAGVSAVSRAYERPGFGNGIDNRVYEVEGLAEEATSNDRISRQHVGYEYFNLLDIPLVSGRTFSLESGTDATDAVVLNEAAVKKFGFTPETALGKKVRTYVYENGQTYGDLTGTVIGVVKDYHSTSLRERIAPTVFMSNEEAYSYYTRHLLVKADGSPQQLMSSLEGAWKNVFPDRPLVASYLDTELEMRYQAEQRLGDIMVTFSVLAILIACLGLYGLASYLAERRTKEMGIRKTLGASVQQLLLLFNQDFLRLIGIAFIIAIPIAWYAMDRWLQDFAYHISIGPLIFVVAGLLCLGIALLTVSHQALRTARTNPVDSLRNE